MKSAFITGITGQDGSYLARILLDKGYKVYGLDRRRSDVNGASRIADIQKDITLIPGDITDFSSLISGITISKPDEVYNLAAMSFVRRSFTEPLYTFDVTAKGAINVFEAVRKVNPSIKIYQASSSEMFGQSPAPQNENTSLWPRSPYGVAKCAAHFAAVNYRESYKMFISCGILFNHESPMRGEEFVTKKVSLAAAKIKAGLQDKLELGNLSAKRDWGYSPEYMEAAWMMLQHNKPDNFVIGTGETHTVKEWVEECFFLVGLDFKDYVTYDKSHEREAEVNVLQADGTKAKEQLGWVPRVKFKELADIMVKYDLKTLSC